MRLNYLHVRSQDFVTNGMPYSRPQRLCVYRCQAKKYRPCDPLVNDPKFTRSFNTERDPFEKREVKLGATVALTVQNSTAPY